ncbi:MAG TPA: DNA topoisomerase I, partial [Candidatus Aenigmarchaeota archaeon]|nr:DNA topoisomerase I [Candidatus Aenigmarchaeota archaeon]
MGYTLIITEKPSAAKRIASALAEGEVKKLGRNGAFYYRIKRGEKDIIVVPAVGHLFVLKEKNSSSIHWKYPVFSVEWVPSYREKGNEWSRKYFRNIENLAKNAEEFISACDYDIEGSVIAYNILRFICRTEKGRRMKFSTLTTPDIVEAYENAFPHLDYPQIEAGLARHEMDWYFGINLSRALTLALESAGGYWTLSTGRVQGPTLSILKRRQEEIKSFKPVPFWEVELHALINENKILASHINGKFWKKEDAERVLEKCRGRNGLVERVEKKRVKQNPPFPFDLTTLQREAYNLFGYSPKQTLDIAQSLYEQALISYPRTSSQKIPPKIGYRNIISRLKEQKTYSHLCERLLQKPALKPNEGSKEDPAHPSIFPTGNKPKNLNRYQKKIYDLIVRRFLSVFAEPAIREQVRITINVNAELFVAHGVTTLQPNWIDFYKPYARFKEQALPEIRKGEQALNKKVEIISKETQPPARYTQASIIKEMERLGLGTKATRAQILQTLYDRSYIKEQSIVVTELGEAVVNALEKHCPEIISVELTRRFEREMEEIEMGRKKRQEILEDAREELKRILKEFKKHEKSIGNEILKAIRKFEHESHTLG